MPLLARRLPVDPREWSDKDLLHAVLQKPSARLGAVAWQELVRRFREVAPGATAELEVILRD